MAGRTTGAEEEGVGRCAGEVRRAGMCSHRHFFPITLLPWETADPSPKHAWPCRLQHQLFEVGLLVSNLGKLPNIALSLTFLRVLPHTQSIHIHHHPWRPRRGPPGPLSWKEMTPKSLLS